MSWVFGVFLEKGVLDPIALVPKWKGKVPGGIFTFLGKSSSEWEEPKYKRGVCGAARSVSLQDGASLAHGVSARLSEPLLCAVHR